MKTTLFVPTLNEIEGMKVLMPQIDPSWVDQILIVDGQSTDGTVEYARECGYDVHIQKKRGIRHAYIEAWPLIKGDIVVTFSPDGNSDPKSIVPLIQKVRDEGYDMVIGSRYLGPAVSDDDDMITGFGNWLFTRTVNLLHGAHYTDAMVMMRAYRTNLFYELDLEKEETYRPEKWAFTVMGIEPVLSVRAVKRRMKVTEIPADEPKRIGGVRKLQVLRWGLAYQMMFFRELGYWK